MSTTITLIASSLIDAGDNDRQNFGQESLESLAASIAANGLLEHPVVRPVPGGRFEIVAGERRFRAVTSILGWAEIPVIVRELTDEQAAESMLAENFHRVNLSPMEEAGAYRKWTEMFGWSNAEIAKRAHTNETRVASRLRLLSLIPDLQFLVNAGMLPLGHAADLVSLDANRQRLALRVIRDNPTITREAFKGVADELFRQQTVEPLFEMAVEDLTVIDAHAKAARPATRTEALTLVERLMVALGDVDPGHELVVEADVMVTAEKARASAAAFKAHASRRNTSCV